VISVVSACFVVKENLRSARIDLGLRRGEVEARLDISKETDDRGIGLSDVAVFLLKVI
jgi:hypothetical protein